NIQGEFPFSLRSDYSKKSFFWQEKGTNEASVFAEAPSSLASGWLRTMRLQFLVWCPESIPKPILRTDMGKVFPGNPKQPTYSFGTRIAKPTETNMRKKRWQAPPLKEVLEHCTKRGLINLPTAY